MNLINNYLYLIISIGSFFSIHFESKCRIYSIILIIYCFLTLFKYKLDYTIHHFLVILLFFHQFFFLYNCQSKEFYENLKQVIKVQYSSIFYELDTFIPEQNKLLKNINSICFVLTFCYYRIYKIHKIMHDVFIWNYISNCSNIFFSIIYYILNFYLYLLNLYWLMIIFKKFSKPILKHRKFSFNKDIKYIYYLFLCFPQISLIDKLIAIYLFFIIQIIQPFYDYTDFIVIILNNGYVLLNILF